MKLNEFYSLLNEVAPKALSDRFCEGTGSYDNSGVLVDTGKEIEKVLFSLDLTFAAIEEAKQQGASLIVTHHPAIYGKISSVRYGAVDPLGKKLISCIESGISVIAMHLNLDIAKGGIDESLRDGIRLAAQKKTGAGLSLNEDVAVFEKVDGGGYGRVYDLPKITLNDLVEGIKEEFGLTRLAVYGDGEKTIERAASFCGSGGDLDSVAFAFEKGAEVVVSSDFKHHVLLLAKELGVAVIAPTHYASENYGFKKYYEKIRRQAEVACVYHTDGDLL